jgi:hypothetical protein
MMGLRWPGVNRQQRSFCIFSIQAEPSREPIQPFSKQFSISPEQVSTCQPLMVAQAGLQPSLGFNPAVQGLRIICRGFSWSLTRSLLNTCAKYGLPFSYLIR